MEEGSSIKIGIVGAESSGKTWLCEALAGHYATTWVPEYAREYFNNSDIYNYTLKDLVIIARKQIELEETLIKTAGRFLFCDTTLITLKIWAELEFSNTPEEILKGLRETPYDYYFITDNQIPWTEDHLRQNKHSRELLFEMNEAEVKKTGIPYSIISGTDSTRFKNAVRILSSLEN